jgi:hypothetical protein
MTRTESTDFGKVLILGQSGKGKSFLSRTADKETTGYINVSRKSLPYKGQFKFHGRPKSWDGFMKNLTDYVGNPEVKEIIIDDVTMAFDMLLEESQKNFKGYDIYGNFNKKVPDYLNLIRNAKKDIIVTGHDEILLIEGYKQKRAKIHGKQFEGLVERFFTTVLYADSKIQDGKPYYFLKTFEEDTSAKTPFEMFTDTKGNILMEIPNDADYIFKAQEAYYSL